MSRPNMYSIWPTRITETRQYQIVMTAGESIKISLMPGLKKDGISFCVSRPDARLLAKRINQCLDATRKK